MNNVINLTRAQRRELFEEAEKVVNLRPVMVEKDFWVCWTLRQLFAVPEAREHAIFKGGTSLSKVWRAIQRFSEDIDISFSREWLGFVNKRDPELVTGKQRKKLLEELSTSCTAKLRDSVTPALRAKMTESLGTKGWSLEVDGADTQTLLFAYPTAFDEAPSYVRQVVKIECGARNDWWPVEIGRVTPYVAEAFPEGMPDASTEVPVLGIERTFWEKAMILHAEAHKPAEKPTAGRYSRHYADLAALAAHDSAELALGRDDLRARVVAHTRTFFNRSWGGYDTAVPGTFRLVPSLERLEELESDYVAIREMFFDTPLPWPSVVASLAELEQRINTAKNSG